MCLREVYVQNEVVETIDLSSKEEKEYVIAGLHGNVIVETKDGAIRVKESNCPHQDCVHMGYISEAGRSIVCIYNQVIITIDGEPINDVEL